MKLKKENKRAIGLAVGILFFATVTVVTVIKFRQVGTNPIAPTAPESKPEASEGYEPVKYGSPADQINQVVREEFLEAVGE